MICVTHAHLPEHLLGQVPSVCKPRRVVFRRARRSRDVTCPDARVFLYSQFVYLTHPQTVRSFLHSVTPFETSVKGMFYIHGERELYTTDIEFLAIKGRKAVPD
jgi:hypothetical protein